MSWRSARAGPLLPIVGEAARIAVGRPVGSVVSGLVVAAVCITILTTTGRTVQAEQAVLGRIDDAGTRSITITDVEGDAGLSPGAVDRLRSLDGVAWVIGLGTARDGRNSAIGEGATPAAVRTLYGSIPLAVDVSGRLPGPGEALVGSGSAHTLGLATAAGGIDIGGAQLAVVGAFDAAEPLTFLNSGLLAAPVPGDPSPLRSLHIQTQAPEQVAAVAAAALSVAGAADPSALSVATSETLADVRAAVAGELGIYSRNLAIAVLGVGLVLVALTVYGSVTLQRQDFGRRRALGATRSAVVSLVVSQYLMVGAIGAGVGTIVGAALTSSPGSPPVDLRFATATALLAALATVPAALVPAIVAARRDPVRVLRVP